MSTHLVCAWIKDEDQVDDSYVMSWCDNREEALAEAEELDGYIKVNSEESIVEIRIFELGNTFKFDFPKEVKKGFVRIEG